MIKQNLEEEKKTNKNKQCGAPGGREKAGIMVHQMVTRNMLRMNEGKKSYLDKKIRFVTALDLKAMP